ncbi:MAG: hypothetical protein KGL39_12285 [Patescibacteria group bacterium]|nr:hypothetical protein [Patescibacteria group bacterium]
MNAAVDVEVKYVNPVKPGKKFGNIKDAGGNLYLVPPSLLNQFTPGMQCKIEYTARTGADGTEWKTITKVVGGSATPIPAAKHYAARKAPNEARQIFVVALLKEIIEPEVTEEWLIGKVEMLKRVYDKTLSGDQTRDDMNDSVPY